MKNLVEFDFYDFRSLLERAARKGHRIERTDRKGWADFLRKNNVPEGACLYHAKQRSMSGEVDTVIISGTSDEDGLYLYSDDDVFCMRYVVEAPPTPAAEEAAPAAEEAAPAAEAPAGEQAAPAGEASAPSDAADPGPAAEGETAPSDDPVSDPTPDSSAS